jgi:hypothetical protein
MAKCNTMPESFTLGYSIMADGKYITYNNPAQDFYYYWRFDGWHFTLGPTGYGDGRQSGMVRKHFSVPLIIKNNSKSAQFFFDNSGQITQNNRDDLTTQMKNQFDEVWKEYADDITKACRELVGYLSF